IVPRRADPGLGGRTTRWASPDRELFPPLPEPNARPGGRHPSQRPTPPPARRRVIDYPRAGRVGWRRWVPSWKLLAGLAGLAVASMAVAFAAAYAATPI